MDDSPILIVKADGTKEPFAPQKLEHSLARAGATPSTIRTIVGHVAGELRDGMETNAIYRHAFELLRRAEKPAAQRYSMKRAVFNLGPTGFPFEDFLAEIYRAKGYTVKTRVVVRGECVSHEVDCVARKEGKVLGIEAKFHNDLGTKSDVRTALYVKARFDDLRGRPLDATPEGVEEYALVTNTKFTSEAIEYGRCGGLQMVSWNYPSRGNLQDLIEETAVYPVTALVSLTRQERGLLISAGLVLCRDIAASPDRLVALGIKEARARALSREAGALCATVHRVQLPHEH